MAVNVRPEAFQLLKTESYAISRLMSSIASLISREWRLASVRDANSVMCSPVLFCHFGDLHRRSVTVTALISV